LALQCRVYKAPHTGPAVAGEAQNLKRAANEWKKNFFENV